MDRRERFHEIQHSRQVHGRISSKCQRRWHFIAKVFISLRKFKKDKACFQGNFSAAARLERVAIRRRAAPWQSTVKLSELFFKEIIERPVDDTEIIRYEDTYLWQRKSGHH
jgi:hypothetical protein